MVRFGNGNQQPDERVPRLQIDVLENGMTADRKRIQASEGCQNGSNNPASPVEVPKRFDRKVESGESGGVVRRRIFVG